MYINIVFVLLYRERYRVESFNNTVIYEPEVITDITSECLITHVEVNKHALFYILGVHRCYCFTEPPYNISPQMA